MLKSIYKFFFICLFQTYGVNDYDVQQFVRANLLNSRFQSSIDNECYNVFYSEFCEVVIYEHSKNNTHSSDCELKVQSIFDALIEKMPNVMYPKVHDLFNKNAKLCLNQEEFKEELHVYFIYLYFIKSGMYKVTHDKAIIDNLFADFNYNSVLQKIDAMDEKRLLDADSRVTKDSVNKINHLSNFNFDEFMHTLFVQFNYPISCS